jgi:hypothetical protein
MHMECARCMYTSGDTVHLASRCGVCRHASTPHAYTTIHLASRDGWVYTFAHLEFIQIQTALQSCIQWFHMHMECARCMYTSGDTLHLASRYGVCQHASTPHEDTTIHLASRDGWVYDFVHLEFLHIQTALQSSIPWFHMHMEFARCMYTSGDTVHIASRYGVCRHVSTPHDNTTIHLASRDGWVYNFVHLEFIHVQTTLQSSIPWFIDAYGMRAVYVH